MIQATIHPEVMWRLQGSSKWHDSIGFSCPNEALVVAVAVKTVKDAGGDLKDAFALERYALQFIINLHEVGLL